MALLLLTYRSLHTSWAIAAVLLAEFLPQIAFGSWFGAFADRYPKRRLIVTACLLQAAAFGGLAVAHTATPILTLALLAGVGNALQRPAMRSALPTLAGEDMQVAAALYDSCRWVGLTAGPAIAAGLFVISGAALPLALNALSFVIAAAVIATVAMSEPPPAAAHESAAGSGIRAGLRAGFASPGVAVVVACSTGWLIGGSLLNVCEPILATHVLHGSGSDYALLVASYGVGMVAATWLVARRGAMPVNVLVQRYVAALILTAIAMGGSAIVGSILPAALTFAATGYANGLLVVTETQFILLRVPQAVQGRLFGAKDTVEGSFILLGLAGAGALIAATGVRFTLAAGGGFNALCAVAAIVAFRRYRTSGALVGEIGSTAAIEATDLLEFTP